MKIIVKKLWFRGDINDTFSALFEIPQLREQFTEGFSYDGELRPRGINIYPGYWPADPLLQRLAQSKKDVYLILTSMDLRGDNGRIHGKGYDRKAIVSNNSFLVDYKYFFPYDPHFNAIVFGEIGHALGLSHHKFDPRNPCEMSHNEFPGPDWKSLQEIRFCDHCYKSLR